MTDYPIEQFQREYRWLSNFQPSPVKLPNSDAIYATVEHAYQAAKTDDMQARSEIFFAKTPGEAKRMGQKVTLRSDWSIEIKLAVMRDLIEQKFNDPDLKQRLIDTGNSYLIEGNWWNDTFWGVCDGVGENNLGKIIMDVRDKLRPKL